MRLLTRLEEHDLAARVHAGDPADALLARNEFVMRNQGLLRTVARFYCGRGLPIEDLMGEGQLGLITAAERYDPAHGTRFGTYASYWIRHAIGWAISNTAATIRIPTHLARLIYQWRRTEQVLTRSGTRPPDFDEIATAMHLNPQERRMIRNARRTTWFRSDIEVLDSRPSAEQKLEAAEIRDQARTRFHRLDARERVVVTLRLGLNGPRQTLDQVSHVVGVSRERIRQIHNDAIKKMAKPP